MNLHKFAFLTVAFGAFCTAAPVVPVWGSSTGSLFVEIKDSGASETHLQGTDGVNTVAIDFFVGRERACWWGAVCSGSSISGDLRFGSATINNLSSSQFSFEVGHGRGYLSLYDSGELIASIALKGYVHLTHELVLPYPRGAGTLISRTFSITQVPEPSYFPVILGALGVVFAARRFR